MQPHTKKLCFLPTQDTKLAISTYIENHTAYMNNIISVSGGNDSIAMLLVIDRLRQQDPDFFKNETWSCVYFNTGWAREGWEKRVDMVKNLCARFGLEFHELSASAINQNIKTDNDELFEMMPDKQHYGMLAHVKKKAFFPNLKMKWCTSELKIKPMQQWLKDNRLTPNNTRQWIGIRREEGGRLGGLAGGNTKDRAFTTSVGERDGFEAVYPICYMTGIQRDKLLKANNIDIYPNRSEECYPCIFQMKVRQLADLDHSRVKLINEVETKITNFRQAKADLMGVESYNANDFFGMFNYKKCGFKKGIVEQSGWAKERVKYLDGLPKQQGLFADEVVIDDKCDSGYCGL
jgi:3'-phosphoadenosine 5'-phosphosulfate sulfotransferase (PAPS reductase)/FAD synthetase